jgi:Asp-tRNA(Asn)/Glu-tRNA(Gln) amidotransferase C subunit
MPTDEGQPPRVLELVVRHGSCTAEGPEQGSAGCIEPVQWGGRLTRELVTALASDRRAGLSLQLALKRRRVPRAAFTRWLQRGSGQLARAAEEEREHVDTLEALLVLELGEAEAERFATDIEQVWAAADVDLRFKMLRLQHPEWGYPTTRHVYREEPPSEAPRAKSGRAALEDLLRRLDASVALDDEGEREGGDG